MRVIPSAFQLASVAMKAKMHINPEMVFAPLPPLLFRILETGHNHTHLKLYISLSPLLFWGKVFRGPKEIFFRQLCMSCLWYISCSISQRSQTHTLEVNYCFVNGLWFRSWDHPYFAELNVERKQSPEADITVILSK